MEVSIETNERGAFLCLGQRHVLVVVDHERQEDEKVDPARLRIHVANLDRHRPGPPERRCCEMDHLARPHRSGWFGPDEDGVVPFTEALGRGEHATYAL